MKDLIPRLQSFGHQPQRVQVILQVPQQTLPPLLYLKVIPTEEGMGLAFVNSKKDLLIKILLHELKALRL